MSSYRGTESTGKLRGISKLEAMNLKGKNVLIVEDMIDTGLTMKLILNKIKSKQPRSLKVALAFHKGTDKNVHMPNYYADYCGFLVPDKFVIGYGMDLDGRFRELKHLCTISQYGISKYVKKKKKD